MLCLIVLVVNVSQGIGLILRCFGIASVDSSKYWFLFIFLRIIPLCIVSGVLKAISAVIPLLNPWNIFSVRSSSKSWWSFWGCHIWSYILWIPIFIPLRKSHIISWYIPTYPITLGYLWLPVFRIRISL